MIRVLHVVHGMDCGGTENMIMNIYRTIDKECIQFDFLVHTKEDCFFDNEIKQLGGKIYRVPYFNGINILKYSKALNSFFALHNEFKIIHGHLGSCAAIYLGIAKSHKIFTIAHSHNTNPSNKKAKDYIYKLFSFPSRIIADFFFACSIDAGIDRFGQKITTGNKFRILRNAINTEIYLPDENKTKRLGLKFQVQNKFVVGHIGRFHPQKNHRFLLQIFSQVLDIHKDSVLILVGDGELRPQIMEQIKQLQLEDNVILTGIRSDANDLLGIMDCFIFPSLYEGLGIVAIEAQCVGIPCFINEALPSELQINKNVFRLSLNATADEWAKAICENTKKLSINEAQKNIINAGYDIKQTTAWLSEFYLKTNEGVL